MAQPAFLTAHQLAQRWNGVVTTGTLANWRSKRVGPPFTKLRGRVLYPVDQVEAWEAANLMKAVNDNTPAKD
ncbi:DNA-binding protein [Microvirga alba]|uniref:DNA-binding protein n=1 Tax=Microvirga alba TaxID=2791025 RepID=A0A931FQ24_9HYPH|nr:DNA-binding protein [Microvirga alba]MBF9235549.1 DNA-binding protein [Microvirga alba]